MNNQNATPRSQALQPEVEQPGGRGPEATAAVERREAFLIVDVEPLRAAIAGEGDGLPDQRCHIEAPTCPRILRLAWRDDRFLSAAARQFREFVIAYFARLP